MDQGQPSPNLAPSSDQVHGRFHQPKIVLDFWSFIGQQGIFGLAVGFIFGSAISDLVNSLVADIIDPVLGIIFFGKTRGLETAVLMVGDSTIAWGRFAASCIHFVVIALVAFAIVKALHLQKIEPRLSISRR